MKSILAFTLGLGLAFNGLGQTKKLVNVDKEGVGIQGYDPVAFFTDAKPVKGRDQFVSRHGGVIYFFSSREHKAAFDKEPAKYEPSYGGYCAYGVSRKKLVEVDVEAFQIVQGHLLLQYSKGVREDFNKDVKANLEKAEANWPVLVEKKGK